VKGDKRKMIIEVVGKEIEKIKGDFESYLNGLNMVGEISYSQYSELYDEGTKQIQRAYELGKSELEKENAELRKVAEFQQSSNMSRHFENKKLKEGLAVGSTFNKALNSMNKNLEEERDKYRNMVFDKDEQLTKAMKHLKDLVYVVELGKNELATARILAEAKEFLKEE
jgi:flagellar hook-basal body complex protein FliE